MSLRKNNLCAESGIATTEFLFLFPIFLLAALFSMETNLMWSDKHILKLAAFEASRVYALADPQIENPCLDEDLKKRARGEMLKQVSSIAPGINVLERSLENFSFQSRIGTLIEQSDLPSGIKKNLQGHVYAAVSTWIECSYFATERRVDVKLIYNRTPKLPMAGGVILKAQQYFLPQGNNELSNRDKLVLYFQSLKERVASMQINSGESLKHLMAISEYQTISSMIADMDGAALEYKNEVARLLELVMQNLNLEEATENDLETLFVRINKVLPDPLVQLPVTVSASKVRTSVPQNPDPMNPAMEKEWQGRLGGALNISGDFSKWAFELGNNQAGYLQDGRAL
ncbi:MAG: hypothetical protein A2X86_20210 [Bdellovibrionales bacterium GWA2_49_15]|nr:MAG: hypothetical protein A2X86_20210 [Bdellovibrionales bacterium GWA2_49_15]HAZ11363.1 hypothetical protein [Bdellovibrionales bacterium]